MSPRLRWHLARLGLHGLAVLILLYTLFPFAWAVVTSLKSGGALFDTALVPADPRWDNYAEVFREQPFGRNILNSAVVATSTVLLSLALGLTAACALGRVAFRGRSLLLATVLGVSMFPQVAVLSGLFELIRWFGLYNTLPALSVSYLIFTLPFTVWVLTAFVRALPIELEEAAMIDGATRFQTFWKVVLPQAVPGMIATGIVAINIGWSEYLFAATLLTSPSNMTISPRLESFMGRGLYNWGWLMAGALAVTGPLIVLSGFMQKHLVAGWGGGALKG